MPSSDHENRYFDWQWRLSSRQGSFCETVGSAIAWVVMVKSTTGISSYRVGDPTGYTLYRKADCSILLYHPRCLVMDADGYHAWKEFLWVFLWHSVVLHTFLSFPRVTRLYSIFPFLGDQGVGLHGLFMSLDGLGWTPHAKALPLLFSVR